MSAVDGGPRVESKRVLSGVLGIVLGGFGVHRFVLGDVAGGLLRILITIATCGIGSVIGFTEGILYLTKSDEEFVELYQMGRRPWF